MLGVGEREKVEKNETIPRRRKGRKRGENEKVSECFRFFCLLLSPSGANCQDESGDSLFPPFPFPSSLLCV